VRKLFRKKRRKPQLEYVKAYAVGAAPKDDTLPAAAAPSMALKTSQVPVDVVDTEPVIAFSSQGDLEAYVEGLNVSSKVIEDWISAGVLLPEETRVAIKMIRLMQQKRKIASD
jgi:hypothetical protein